MGKQYYCDYCQRSFADSAENRKKHLSGVYHKRLQKEHYDQFQGARSILQQNMIKKPCHKFHNSGYCEFGDRCKYSHLTPSDISALEERARQEESKVSTPHLKQIPDIDGWLRKKLQEKGESATKEAISHLQIPPALVNIPDLPPSLIPATPDQSVEKLNQWGR